MQRTQIGGFQPTSTPWGKLKRCNNEDGTENTYAVDKRIKDKCDEKADEWTDNVLERFKFISQSEQLTFTTPTHIITKVVHQRTISPT